MYGYVYMTTNLINGKKYIGQHKSCDFDNSYIGSGSYLTNAIKKYGRNNFKCELLQKAENKEALNNLEEQYIKKYDAVNSDEFYNILPGGGNHERPDMLGANNHNHKSRGGLSQSTKNKISLSHRQLYIDDPSREGTFKGKTHSKATRDKISAHRKNKIVVNDGTTLYYIDESELSEYLDNGYVKGKINKRTSQGRVWMNNGSHNIYPNREDSTKYIDEGYVYGFISRKTR